MTNNQTPNNKIKAAAYIAMTAPIIDAVIDGMMTPLEKKIYGLPEDELLKLHELVLAHKSCLSRRQRELVLYRVKTLKATIDDTDSTDKK